jgi:nicotinate-nucleotide--dimethylbenzimidazole phosphoribosyltransferase
MIRTYQIEAVNQELITQLQHQINIKTKPIGALGKLEKLALKIGLIQQTIKPVILHPTMLIFAADHGIVAEGVSPYPQEVTWQMVMNFVNGGAAINVFAKQNGWKINIIDAGVNTRFSESLPIHHVKINYGTKNFLHEPAMTEMELKKAVETGEEFINFHKKEGSNCVAFGEMGIGNTSSAAVIMSKILKLPIEECVGRGTGLDDAGLRRKTDVLKKAILKHEVIDPKSILQTFGGFEIAMMAGAMLRAAEQKMLIIVDGFIVTSALLIAHALHPEVLDYCVFAHQSDENGHQKMLNYFNADPLLKLDMRLGEGTGAALALPLIQASVNFLNDMASFESAGVSS